MFFPELEGSNEPFCDMSKNNQMGTFETNRCCCCLPLGGSGKQRTKEPKKKNTKQKLRVRAQNQHSDHLSSVRSSHRD